jgi:hypothetical protein
MRCMEGLIAVATDASRARLLRFCDSRCKTAQAVPGLLAADRTAFPFIPGSEGRIGGIGTFSSSEGGV